MWRYPQKDKNRNVKTCSPGWIASQDPPATELRGDVGRAGRGAGLSRVCRKVCAVPVSPRVHVTKRVVVLFVVVVFYTVHRDYRWQWPVVPN